MKTKKRIVMLIDGENIGAKRNGEISRICKERGEVYESKVYHRQKDMATRQWSEECRKSKMKDICLYGGPCKNKVDKKIQEDAKRYMKASDVDVICIVTSDGDFARLKKIAKTSGKKILFIGEKKAPEKLRKAGCFVELK